MHCSFFLFLTPTSARNLATLHYASKVAQNCHKPKKNANLKRKTEKNLSTYLLLLSHSFSWFRFVVREHPLVFCLQFRFLCFQVLFDGLSQYLSRSLSSWHFHSPSLAELNVAELNNLLFSFFFCNLKHRVNNGYLFSVCFFNNNHMFFCSVNIISWFTWVSLFNNVCFCSVSSSCLSRITFCLFSVSWHERVLLFSLSLERCVSVCVCRALSMVNVVCIVCLLFFLLFYIAFYLRCMRLLYWLGWGFSCVCVMLLSSRWLVWWWWWWSWWWLMLA